jgi:hypothetical protein
VIGRLTIHGQTYSVYKADLHLPILDGSRYLFLTTYVGPADDDLGFALWEVELPLLKRLDLLDGQRIHVRPGGEGYEDDTLGTDIIGMREISRWGIGMNYGVYGDIQIDFRRIQGREYRCVVECSLSDADLEDQAPSEHFEAIGRADFTVIADEVDPYADSR